MGQLTEIARYPVKSCRGEALTEALVEPWGLTGDRRWMLVDDGGKAVTAREVGELVLITPELQGDPGSPDSLVLRAPGRDPLVVRRPDPDRQRPVQLFSSRITAAPAPEADAWLSSYVGRSVHLVWLDDPRRRATEQGFGLDDDRVSLADGYPLLLATEESLAALNDQVLAGAPHPRDPLPMTRFRPNLVVRGHGAWAEDDWRRVRIGSQQFRVVKACARCVVTTVDPQTGEREREPLDALARLRRVDGGIWFGLNLVPDSPFGRVRVGDEVEVLTRAEPGGGPLRVSGDPVWRRLRRRAAQRVAVAVADRRRQLGRVHAAAG